MQLDNGVIAAEPGAQLIVNVRFKIIAQCTVMGDPVDVIARWLLGAGLDDLHEALIRNGWEPTQRDCLQVCMEKN